MRVWHDYSYIGSSDNEFISRGYAKDDLYSVRISFEYSEEEQRENRKNAEGMTVAEWSAHCAAAALRKSEYIFPVMEAIAGSFVCYQYDKDCQLNYCSPNWELYFWCNDFYNSTRGRHSGRDYSYITLSFNTLHDTERRNEICKKLLQFLTDGFSDRKNLSVAVQHTTCFLDSEIRKAASPVAEGFHGMKGSYDGMDGKFIQTDKGLVFKKKYARSRYYKVRNC